MANYVCEATTLCTNYQSAICLHCNRRLCLSHITEHNQIVLSSVQNLQMNREIYHNVLTSSNEWRIKQLEKISQIYETHLQSVESQQEALNIVHQELTEMLDRDARQPLNFIQTKRNGSVAALDHIEQTIKKVQKHSVQLQWNFSTSLPLNALHQSPKPLPSPVSTPTSTPSNNPPNTITKTLCKLRSLQGVNLRKYRSFKRLVDMFSDITHIEQSKHDIAAYVDKHHGGFPLPILVCSYLAAWYRKSEMNEKNIVIKEHLATIMKHVPNHIEDYTVLLGIHAFFYNERIQGNKRELMTFLLQYFFEQKCLTRRQIYNWYSNKDADAYQGFDGAKQMTTPFIQSLWTNSTGTNVQAVPTNSTGVKIIKTSSE